MNRISKEVLVIGGGSAGMAAAAEIAEKGHSVVIIERESTMGGILNQCIHNGFGAAQVPGRTDWTGVCRKIYGYH